MARFVYDFADGADAGRELLGGKGAGLAEMTALDIPVPSGFTVTTAACVEYMRNGKTFPEGLEAEVELHLRGLEERAGKRLGHAKDPLLVSVRSGAAVSMPGMMDTILNLGLNDTAVEGLAASTENPRFAWDAYRRLIQMYGDVVAGLGEREVRGRAGRAQGAARREPGRGPHRGGPPGAGRPLPRDLPRRRRGGLPPGSAPPARAVDPGRLRLVGDAARPGVPPRARDPRRSGDGGEHRPDGLRQPRRKLGHRRLFYA